MKNELRDILPRLAMYIFRFFRINPKKAVFKSFRGVDCGDNPRAIYEEMYKRRPDYKYVWVTQDMTKSVPGAVMVKHGSFREIYELATARLWVDNKRKGCWARKRRGQLYIQTWHGGICLKKIEKDAAESLPAYYIKSAKQDSAMADAMTSSSKWQNAQYRNSFWFKNRILEYGLPRADILYTDPTEIKKRVRKFYSLPDDAKMLLYAPTYRDDNSTDAYDINYTGLINALEKRYGGNWYVVVRLHPNFARKTEIIEYNDRVLNGTKYPIMNELLITSDFLITDYSSCMFDGMEIGKRVLLYAADIDKYNNDRGFYFDIRTLPFPIAENNDELGSAILNYSDEVYDKKVQSFKAEVGLFNDGHASERTVDYILSRIEYRGGRRNRFAKLN